MTLEPLVTTAEVAPHRELEDMTRRLWVGAVLALAVFVLEIGILVVSESCKKRAPSAPIKSAISGLS